jgi:hypothetical protein
MGAVLKPGWLYFLGEEDYTTGIRSPYVKIGKTDYDKPVSKRITEHETANPRRVLEVAPSIRTEFIDPLETHMHHRFSLNRVHGEWFRFTPAKLRAAVVEAKRVNAEMSALVGKAKRANTVAKKVSNGSMKMATAAAKKAHTAYVTAEKQRTLLELKQQEVVLELRRLAGTREGIAEIVDQIMPTPSVKLDKNALEAKRGALYRRFVVQKTSFTVRFSITGKPTAAKVHPTAKAKVEAKAAKLPVVTVVKGAMKSRSSSAKKWHAEWLRLHSEMAALSWESNRREIEIKSLCGDAEGIEGVCTWKRENKTTSKFDGTAFKKAHPRIWSSFTKTSKPSVRFTVNPMRPY